MVAVGCPAFDLLVLSATGVGFATGAVVAEWLAVVRAGPDRPSSAAATARGWPEQPGTQQAEDLPVAALVDPCDAPAVFARRVVGGVVVEAEQVGQPART